MTAESDFGFGPVEHGMKRTAICILLALLGVTGCSDSTGPAENLLAHQKSGPTAATPKPSQPNPPTPDVPGTGKPDTNPITTLPTSTGAAPTEKPTKPNILVIVAD